MSTSAPAPRSATTIASISPATAATSTFLRSMSLRPESTLDEIGLERDGGVELLGAHLARELAADREVRVAQLRLELGEDARRAGPPSRGSSRRGSGPSGPRSCCRRGRRSAGSSFRATLRDALRSHVGLQPRSHGRGSRGARCCAAAPRPRAAAGAEPAQARPLTRAGARAARGGARAACSRPATSGYDAARVVFNRRWDGVKPPAVVRVRDTADVRAVVRWADRYDVPLVSRSGGHGYSGNSTSATAVVVDVDALDCIRYADGSATVGPGARCSPSTPRSRGAASRSRPARARRWRSAGSCSAAGWGSPGARWGSRSTA